MSTKFVLKKYWTWLSVSIPHPSHCVHLWWSCPKCILVWGTLSWEPLGGRILPASGQTLRRLEPASPHMGCCISAAFIQLKPRSDSTEPEIQMHIWDPMKPVLQTMICREWQSPADLGLCSPSSRPCSLEGSLANGGAHQLVRTLHMLWCTALQGPKGSPRPGPFRPLAAVAAAGPFQHFHWMVLKERRSHLLTSGQGHHEIIPWGCVFVSSNLSLSPLVYIQLTVTYFPSPQCPEMLNRTRY